MNANQNVQEKLEDKVAVRLSTGRKRQSQIYVAGISGERPAVPIDPQKLEAKAEEVMDPEAFAYIAGGAGAERSMAANRQGFDRWGIVQRMLRDVSHRDSSVKIFGRQYDSPFLLAPIGVLEMAHPEADVAVAKAAARERVPMIFSNQASFSMEDCAAVMGDSPRWFQLYWSVSNDLVESLVKRAEKSGCEAIVVTLDTTLLGWRPRDLDLAYLPFMRGKGIAQYTSDPVFQALLKKGEAESELDNERKINLATIRTMLELMGNYPDSFLRNLTSGEPLQAVRKFIGIYSRPSLTWEDLGFLRELTDLPVVLKGIMHPEDAKLAVKYGMDGIVVSNHGGRQVDGGVGAIEMLPEIKKAVGDKLEILFDSGIRTGADAFKALALGAKGVLIGRPFVYALACAGEAGVRELLQNFKADFDLTMGLSGYTSTAQIDAQALRERALYK